MQRSHALRLIDQLRTSGSSTAPAFELASDRYRSQAWFDREAPLRALPRIATVASAIAPGACLPLAGGVLLVRDQAGTLRAFANACRHRGTRLVASACAVKALVCPYHGWTYDLAGTLIHVPHAEVFGGAESGRDLRAIPVLERHGFVWLGAEIETLVAPLAADLEALGAPDLVLFQSSLTRRRCNWKFLVEAFLDGYHCARCTALRSTGSFSTPRRSPSLPVRTFARSPRVVRCTPHRLTPSRARSSRHPCSCSRRRRSSSTPTFFRSSRRTRAAPIKPSSST